MSHPASAPHAISAPTRSGPTTGTTTSTSPDSTPARPARRGSANGLARVAVLAALMAVLGAVPPIPVAGIPAPIVAQNIAVMLAGIILGPWRGAAAMVLFNALVALGLPLLSGFRGGLGVMVGPTAGFILGWIPAALVVGLVFWAMTGRARPGIGAGRIGIAAALASIAGGIAVLYLFGALGFILVAGTAPAAAFAMLPAFLPGDLVKVAVATVLAAGLWKAYPRAFR